MSSGGHGRAGRLARLARAALLAALTGLAGIALAAVGCGPDGRAGGPGGGTGGDGARPPDLLLISLDTVRRDHLSIYGYERPTTPRIDALAARGEVWDQAVTASTQTGPSHASFFTGLHPHEHGAEMNGAPIRGDVVTLAERLSGHGYATAAFVSGLPLRAEVCGLSRGFDHYDDDFEGSRRDGAETVRRAGEWLVRSGAPDGGEGERRPRFLFVHLYDAHGPYVPPAGYGLRFRSDAPPRMLDLDRMPDYQVGRGADGQLVRDFEDYRDRYDTMIRYQDDLLAGLLDRLDLDRTVVMVVSDHGESLDERWWKLDHGGGVWEEQVRIPWILAGPGVEPGRVARPVRGVDLASKLLDAALGAGAGDPLRPRGEAAGDAPGVAISTAVPFAIRHRDRGYELTRERPILGLRAATAGGAWKLIAYPCPGAPCVELYDLGADPGETRNLEAEEPERRDRMLRTLDAWYTGDGPADPESLDPEVRKRLESLGYIGGG
jgi:arylsulfatase A-like enzyme